MRARGRGMSGAVGLASATTVFALVAGLLVLPSAAASQAYVDPARPAAPAGYASIPIQETGRIVSVLDGDTFRFMEDGANQWVKVRLLGVNTPEVTGFNNIHFDENMCGGQEAWHLLQSIIPAGTRVQLRSNSKEASNRGRILRYVFAYNNASGQYDIDVQGAIAESGLAMWFAIDEEASLSQPYRLVINRAQQARRGIWDPNHCGPAEQPGAQVKLTVSWDAPGQDNQNLNGEFVVVRNVGSVPVDLSGWLLRDSSLTSWYYFPGGSVLAAGDYYVVHVGRGTAGQPTSHDLYIGATEPLFPNPQPGEFLGDGAYLLDTRTSVRFYDEYPCLVDCSNDPLVGQVKIVEVNAKSKNRSAAKAANEEFVVVKNVSSAAVLLDGYYLRRKVSTFQFPANTILQPGQTLTVRIGKGSPSAATQYWGQSRPLLTNTHDRVELLSNRDVRISEVHW